VDSLFLPFFITTLAWFFQAFTGFGAGIFIVSFLSLVHDPKEVVVTSTLVNLFGNLLVFRSLRKRRPADLRVLGWLVLGSSGGIALSSAILVDIEREVLSVIIGGFILFLGLYDYGVQRGLLRVRLKRNLPAGVLSGFLGGFFAGLVGMGGPPPVVFLNQVCRSHEEMKLILALYFTFNVLSRTFFYLLYGGAHLFNLKLLVVSLIGVPFGVFLGLKLSGRLGGRRMKRIVSLSVLLAGFLLLLRAL